MIDPIAAAYAAPKAESAGGVSPEERERRSAVCLAAGFLIGSELIRVGFWLHWWLPLRLTSMYALMPSWTWFIPRVANGVAAVLLLRGRRRMVWLPIAVRAWEAFRHVSMLDEQPFRTLLELTISVVYAGILLVLMSKRPGPRIKVAVVGVAVYVVLVVVQWFTREVIVIEIPRA
jgi:hypothetical protein